MSVSRYTLKISFSIDFSIFQHYALFLMMSKKYDLILVVIDYGLTKVSLFISCYKTCYRP